MARALDLTGRRFGKLVAVESQGHAVYGGRKGLQWLCRCDCGESLTLHAAKLPYSKANIRAAEKAGRLIYTCCETCRQKICQVCGDRYSYSHPSHVCPKRSCQEELQREREAIWHRRAMARYREDPDFREQFRQYQARWYEKNSRRVAEQRRDRITRMTPEELERYEQRRYERGLAYYEAVKADPERYAERLAQGRVRAAERAALEFFETAQKLIENHDTE